MKTISIKVKDRVVAVLFILILAFAYYITLDFNDRVGSYPRTLIIIGLCLCVFQYLKTCLPGVKLKGKDSKVEVANALALGGSVLAMLIYIPCIRWIGYCCSTFAFLLAEMWLLEPKAGKKQLLSFLLISAIAALILYVLFGKLLSVFLPAGLLF